MTLDKFLTKALDAFNSADYHPFTGIEDEIRAARLGTPEEKRKLLLRLPAMLAKSDVPRTRMLAEEIRAVLS